MKYSMMMALVFCGVLAFTQTGCKYDDNEGAVTGDEAATAVATNETDENATGVNAEDEAAKKAAADAAAAAAAANADETSLDAALGQKPFDEDPNYVRCTDVDFPPVYFGFDASNLPAGELAKIEAVAQHLKAKGRVVIVEGNCDERGSNEYNLSLGENRAISIQDYLLKLGVDAKSVQTKSYGEEKPAVQGQGEASWSKNRRGEFAVFQHK